MGRSANLRVSRFLCAAIILFGLTLRAAADDRQGYAGSNGGKPGNLSFGCLPKEPDLILYWIGDKGIHPKEQDSVSTFPEGYTRHVERIVGAGPVNFMVDAILQSGDRQVLRGHLVNMRGLPLEGVFYVSPQDWNCELHVDK
jgi:hypothetical protein